MRQDTVFCEKKIVQLFSKEAKPLVMGILNVTPDSFFDGGKYEQESMWLARVETMVGQGADIIDIGAYSTRPGAKEVSEQEETERLVKAVASVRKAFPDTLISADTFGAEVARKAVEAGADIVNDISGGTMDERMFALVAQLNVPYVLTHIQGTPKTMQQEPYYTNVVQDVYAFFENIVNKLKQSGLTKIILDPGFGFGKTVEHNYQLLQHLQQFNDFGLPVLVGVSRKSMIHNVLNVTPDEALNGTTVLNTIALMKGAKIVRVHDVREAKEAVDLVIRTFM